MTTGTVGEVWPGGILAGIATGPQMARTFETVAFAMKFPSPRCPDTGHRHELSAIAVETLRETGAGGCTNCLLCEVVIYVPPSTCR